MSELSLENEPKLNWSLLKQLWNLIKPYWSGSKKRQAWTLLIILIAFCVLVNAVNAYKTYITKWAIDALTAKDASKFYDIMFLAIVSLAASIPVVALKDYYQNKLSLYWC